MKPGAPATALLDCLSGEAARHKFLRDKIDLSNEWQPDAAERDCAGRGMRWENQEVFRG
jgi:hypothetical protein